MSALKLHDYQQVALDHLRSRPRAGLFLDMGLGKTAIALSALTPEHLPALILAPKRVTQHVWPTEAKLWRPDLHLTTAVGRPEDRHKALASASHQSDLVVLGVDSIRDAVQHRRRFRTLIIDESSRFKNYRSQRWKAAKAMAYDDHLENLWLLTGTPSPNGLMDLWAQVALLDRGKRLGRNITAYRRTFFDVGTLRNGKPAIIPATGVVTSWEPKPGAQETIQTRVEDLCLSMRNDGRISLPPMTINPVEVPLPSSAMRPYRQLKNKLAVDLDLIGEITHTASNAAVLTSKLSQLCAGFLYDQDELGYNTGTHTVVHREKVKAVRDIVDETGSPVLVFYRFQAELEMLRSALPEALHIDDQVEGSDPISAWNDGRVPILLAHPASAGHGLNLQYGGHTIVWTTLPWSLEEWEQANTRLARQGQPNPVVVHTLMAPRTVDQAIQDALADKKNIQDALMDHLESPL